MPRLPLHFFSSFFVLLSLAFCDSAAAENERTYEKSFAVPSSRAITVETFHGPIRVIPSTEEKITVTVTQSTPFEAADEIDAAYKNLRLEPQSDAQEFTFTARYVRTLRWAWETWPPVRLTTEIKVPARCHLILRARDGGITVPACEANLTLLASKGDCFVGELTGNLTAEATQGDLTVTACSGDLKLRTHAGSILVGRTGRSAQITGTDGEIEVQRVLGPLTLRGDRAPVKVGFPAPILNNATLSTNGEELTVLIDPSAPCTLQAQAGTFGEVQVDSDLALTPTSGAPNTSKLNAHHKGGGPLLSLKASGGHVRIKALPTLPAAVR